MCRQLAQEALNEGRGRDPGDTGNASGMRSTPSSLNEGRGRDPGDTTLGPCVNRATSTLNEGRGRDPGDTRIEAPLILEEPRSTKAGAETPATLSEDEALILK